MFSTKSARLLIAACCAALLVVLGISRFKHREDPTAPPHHSACPMQAPATQLPAIPETTPTQTSDAKAQESGPSADESAQSSAIPAFRQWAETAAVSGFAQVDQNKAMGLAKARATAMKTLIRRDPDSALREALPADLRASLPPQIAAAIEQPVRTTGMCSIQIMCNHSPDSPHGSCENTPVLLEEVASWNAHYGARQWQGFAGKEVDFDGIAVGEELAVRSITPISNKQSH